jgi:hypothetical protein
MAIASAIACGCLVWSDEARADEAPTLFLGPAHALRVVETARQARERATEAEARATYVPSPVVPARSMPDIVPPRFHIPDGYEIDLERDVPRFAAPVDRDNLVSFELLDRGVGVFLDYDEESYPIGDGGEMLMLQIERRF